MADFENAVSRRGNDGARQQQTPDTVSRRSLFFKGAAAAAVLPLTSQNGAAQTQVAALSDLPNLPPPDTTHHSMRQTAGRKRSTFVKDLTLTVDLNPNNQGGAYWNFKTLITPVDQFYVRNEFATPRPELEPRVDPRHWTLRIHGDAVERELTITYDDLLKMPSRSIIATMECAGNGRSLFWEQQNMLSGATEVTGTGWGLGGIGQADWQYVPISHILGLVGIKNTAKAALFWSGVDNRENKPGAQGDRGRPLPIDVIRMHSDAIGLAFKMNGYDLPADHGGPVRALVPGYCGAASTKWITEIKIASHNFWVPLNTTAHVMIGPDYPVPVPEARDEFRFVQRANILGPAVSWSPPKSMLTLPLVLSKQPKFPHNYPLKRDEWPKVDAGLRTMRGYAWAPRYGVKFVEYRINGGQWTQARIELPNMGRFTWVRFDFPWDAKVGRHVLETRVTDRRNFEQPETVPFNRGGFDFWAVPKFKVDVV